MGQKEDSELVVLVIRSTAIKRKNVLWLWFLVGGKFVEERPK